MTEADLTPDLISARRWTDQDVQAARLPMVDVPFVTVGGGLGSLAMVDVLADRRHPVQRDQDLDHDRPAGADLQVPRRQLADPDP